MGVPDDYYFEILSADIAERLFAALDVLKDLGATCRGVRTIDMHKVNGLGRIMFGFEAFQTHGRWIDQQPTEVSPLVRARLEAGRTVSRAEYLRARQSRTLLKNQFVATSLRGVDVLITPCVPVHTPTIDEAMNASVKDSLDTVDRITRCTRAINYLTLPAIAVPCGFVATGLPVAFQLVARPFREGTLLRAADAYQRNTDWHAQHPTLPGLAQSISSTPRRHTAKSDQQ